MKTVIYESAYQPEKEKYLMYDGNEHTSNNIQLN